MNIVLNSIISNGWFRYGIIVYIIVIFGVCLCLWCFCLHRGVNIKANRRTPLTHVYNTD